jgi:hypothetical protein
MSNFIGNDWIKSTFTIRRYEKLTEYLHVSDRTNEPNRGDENYDKLYKVRPVLDMTKQSFSTKYKLHKNIHDGIFNEDHLLKLSQLHILTHAHFGEFHVPDIC